MTVVPLDVQIFEDRSPDHTLLNEWEPNATREHGGEHGRYFLRHSVDTGNPDLATGITFYEIERAQGVTLGYRVIGQNPDGMPEHVSIRPNEGFAGSRKTFEAYTHSKGSRSPNYDPDELIAAVYPVRETTNQYSAVTPGAQHTLRRLLIDDTCTLWQIRSVDTRDSTITRTSVKYGAQGNVISEKRWTGTFVDLDQPVDPETEHRAKHYHYDDDGRLVELVETTEHPSAQTTERAPMDRTTTFEQQDHVHRLGGWSRNPKDIGRITVVTSVLHPPGSTDPSERIDWQFQIRAYEPEVEGYLSSGKLSLIRSFRRAGESASSPWVYSEVIPDPTSTPPFGANVRFSTDHPAHTITGNFLPTVRSLANTPISHPY